MTLVDRLIVRFSIVNRRRKGEFVKRYMRQHSLRSVLFVGSGGAWSEEAHVVEAAAAAVASFAVACDLHTRIDAAWPYVRCDALRLPFPADTFDLVLSNAVIEHVGDEIAQRNFVAEHARVGRHLVITTPNRFFPVESHTRTAFLHWLPSWRAQRSTYFTRLLSRAELQRLLPPQASIHGGLLGATLTATCRPDERPAVPAGREDDGAPRRNATSG
ncbi:MAG: Methyltransferase type 11 [Acidimicrobiales bacterium]|nr:Methyltransferase type 11 [Acidimicrobiales bacterium]